MALRIRVRGGTDGGNKVMLERRRDEWRCSNGHVNKPNHLRCMESGCNERRDR